MMFFVKFGEGEMIFDVMLESVGWIYVGFEVLWFDGGVVREIGDCEVCIVVIEGIVTVCSEHGEWCDLGGCLDLWLGMFDVVYFLLGMCYELFG